MSVEENICGETKLRARQVDKSLGEVCISQMAHAWATKNTQHQTLHSHPAHSTQRQEQTQRDPNTPPYVARYKGIALSIFTLTNHFIVIFSLTNEKHALTSEWARC